MNKFHKLRNQIITEFIAQLQAEPALLEHGYPEHFIELGYDIAEGNGEIRRIIKNTLGLQLRRYPPSVIEWLWWQTPSGRVQQDCIYAAFQTLPPDFGRLAITDEDDEGENRFKRPIYLDEERFANILEYFYEPVEQIAEASFHRYDHYGFYDINHLDKWEFYENGGIE